MANTVYVVYKNVSIDVSTIGVCNTNKAAKKLCEKDYELDDGKNIEGRRLYYTIEEYVLDEHYPGGVKRLIDYIPNMTNEWSEMTIQRNVDFISIDKEDYL